MVDAIGKIDLSRLRIVKYPDPVLRRACVEVAEFGEDLRALAERMFALMYQARGVGLAAPQVGVPVRLFVFNPTGEPGKDEGVCVNPRLLEREGVVVEEEGCLSLPNVTCKVKRFARVTLQAQDLEGSVHEFRAGGLVARIFQHELDHLDGVLIIDRMSPVAKLANRRALRELEAAYERARS